MSSRILSGEDASPTIEAANTVFGVTSEGAIRNQSIGIVAVSVYTVRLAGGSARSCRDRLRGEESSDDGCTPKGDAGY